ncbi:MAG: protoporphyrinogen oxidase [Planctomycetes bacterium]|nr:protoporphyrinogen oxidase [Planctomycetota bacterium]
MSAPPDQLRIVVIGGGVSGLAAAHRLVEQDGPTGQSVEVIVLESTGAPGGSISTTRRDGFLLEGGPDAFITQKPWALQLCERLGIIDSLIQTNEHHRRTFVVRRGRLHAMPEGFMMLAPSRLWPFAFSRLFSLRGKLRMGLDLVLPRGRVNGDESLASFVRRRLGREALERAAQPLVSGIYTADPEKLSVLATMPRFLEMEAKHRSLILAMRRAGRDQAKRGEAGARYSLFVSFADGMDTFVKAIVDRLPTGALRLNQPVTALRRGTAGRTWSIETGDGQTIEADGVIMTAPAYALAKIIADLDNELANLFSQLEYASSATLNLAFRRHQIAHPLDGFGVVVPHVERRTIIAATFSQVKFAGRAPEGMALIRAFIGGALNPDVFALDDADLLRGVMAELTDLLGIDGPPLFTTLERWPASMPQYAVGHLDRVAQMNQRLDRLPALAAAGNAFGGVGIPDCVHGGEQAADAVLAALTKPVRAT